MKKITLKKEVVIEEVKFQANDGTIFNDEKECKIYEESYLGILKTEYAKMEKVELYESEFLKFTGSEDYLISIVEVNTDKDVDTLLKLNLYFSSWMRNNEEKINEVKDKLEKSKGKKVIIGRGIMYNDGKFEDEAFSVIEPLDDWIAYIMNISTSIKVRK